MYRYAKYHTSDEENQNILVRIWLLWESLIGKVLSPLFADKAAGQSVRQEHVTTGKKSSFFARRKFLLFSSLILIILAPLAYLAYTYQSPVEAEWYDDAYAYRKKITFTNSGSAITSSRRMLVEVDTATLITDGDMQSDCDDTRFTTVNGQLLNFYIQDNDGACNTASTDYYVELKNAPAGPNAIYIYYGNPAAQTGQTWDSLYTNIEAFWKMEESSGTRTSTTGTNDLSETNSVTSTTGKIGNAASFDGTNDYLSIDSGFDGEASGWRTWAGWVYFNSLGSAEYILSTSTSGGSTLKQQLWKTTGDVPNVKMGSHSKSSTETLSTDTWYHIVGVWTLDPPNTDNPDVIVYVNGVNRGSRGVPTTASTIDRLDIGANKGGSTPIDGRIDAAGYWEKKLTQAEIDRLYNGGTGLELDPPDMFTPGSGPTLGTEEQSEGPSTYWRFDQGFGTTVQDTTQNDNDGTRTNASWVQPGLCLSGKCLQYDGDGDYVSRADDADFDFAAADSFSISGWFRHGVQSSGTDVIAAKYESTGGDGGYKILMESDGDITFGIDDDNSSFPEDSVTSTTADYDDNRWHHFTAVKNGTTSISLYIDGILIGTDSSIAATGTLANDDAFYLGIDGDGSSNDWLGFIDDFKIYPYVRSLPQIKRDFNGRAGSLRGTGAVLGSSNEDRLSDGLLGYWKLDESSANTCTGGTNDSCDSSGNGHDGAWTGNATNISGKFGQGVDFDGTDDEINVGSDAALDDIGDGKSFSVSAWINGDTGGWSGSNQVVYVSKHNNSGGNGWGLYDQFNGKPTFIVNHSTTDAHARHSSVLSENRWYHLVGTFDHVSGIPRLFIDGAEANYTGSNGQQITAVGSYTTDASHDLMIGSSDKTSSTDDVDGQMDEVRIYNRVLSPAEIRQLYNWAPGPVGHWDFNENTGTSSVNDISGNGYTGTMNGTMTDADWVPGKYGAGLDFDGTDDSISNTSFTPISNYPVTVSAWVKGGDTATEHIITLAGTSNNAYLSLETESGGGGDNAVLAARNTTNQSITGTTNIIDGEWHHVVGVYRSATDRELYVNGVSEGKDTASVTIPTLSRIGIGYRNDGSSTNRYYDGVIDDVRVYNYARTPKQIIADMNNSHPAGGSPIASQLAYWNFDEQQGQTINDAGYGDKDGTRGTDSSAGSDDPTWKTKADCKINGCVDFDGGDYVENTKYEPADYDYLNDGFTITAWVNADDLQASCADRSCAGIATQGWGNHIWASYGLFLADSKFRMSIYSLGNTSYRQADTTSTLATDTWYHVAGVFDPDANKLRIYLNGKLEGTDDWESGDTFETTSATYRDFSIGSKIGDSNEDFHDGQIDEVKIYNSPLTVDEILIDMTSNSGIDFGSTTNEADDISGGAGNPPVGHWNLDEKSTGASSVTRAGISGNDNTLGDGTTTPSARGKIGAAADFSGTNEMLNITDASQTGLDITGSITISGWINPDTVGTGTKTLAAKALEKDSSDDSLGYLCGVYQVGAVLKGRFYLSSAGTSWDGALSASSGTEVPTGSWTHITCVYDGTNMYFYHNGTVDASTAYSSGIYDNGGDFALGGTDYTGGGGVVHDFDGQMDEVKVYDYARTKAQIAYDYNRGAPVAHYKLDECTGTTAYSTKDPYDSALDGTITIGASGTNTSAGTCDGSSGEAWFDGASGKFGSSLEFDGTDDYISVSDNDLIDFAATDDFSVTLWAKLDSDTTGYMITKNDSWHMYYNASSDVFNFGENGSSGSDSKNCNSGTIQVGQWHFFEVRFDGDDVLTCSVDLKRPVTRSATQVDPLPGSGTLDIGRQDSGSYFPGEIDDVRIYNYELSFEQVQKIMNEGSGVRFGD